MQDFIGVLAGEFREHGNAKIALEQKAYMRNQFEYFGLKAQQRRVVQKPFLLKRNLPKKEKVSELVVALWQMPQRDFQYFGQELAFKYVKQLEETDIELFEFMVIHKSWWDTVDFIAVKLLGAYFKKFPEQREGFVKKWLESENIWLQRSALLFQLKYKEDVDVRILSNTINYLLGSPEFFINKAIGWVLREYSRTNPKWVVDFADKTELNALSRREALRLL